MTAVALAVTRALYAQTSPYIEWERSYGGAGRDALFSVKQTLDGGFVLGGYSNSGLNGNKTATNFGGYDYWLVRTDSQGNKLWDAAFGGASNDVLSAVLVTSDNGFLLAGSSASRPSGNKTTPAYGANDYWVLRLNSVGEKLWERSFGGTNVAGGGDDVLQSIDLTPDGGFILAGWSTSFGGSGNKTSLWYGGYDFWIVRLDANGNKIWEQSLGGEGSETNVAVTATHDSGCVIGGYSASGATGNKTNGTNGAWVVRLDANGNKVWEKNLFQPGQIYSGAEAPVIATLTELANGEILVGMSWSEVPSGGQWPATYFKVLRLDPSGSVVWNSLVIVDPYSGFRRFLIGVRQVADGGYILGGRDSYLLIREDAAGNVLWRHEFPTTPYSQVLRSLEITTDGAFILGGEMGSFSTADFRLLKVAERPRLAVSSSPLDSSFRFRLHGAPGSYLIERSNDLVGWQPWRTSVITSASVEITETNIVAGQNLYRARLLP